MTSIRIGPTTGDGPVLLFALRDPAPSSGGRFHLDLRPQDRDRCVARALELGATLVDWGRTITSWTVLADLEGNEFCVLQSAVNYEQFAVECRGGDSAG